MNIAFALTDIATAAGSFATSRDLRCRVAMPNALSVKDIAKLRRDCEILLGRLTNNPKAFQKLVTAVSGGDLVAADAIIDELKLGESDVEKEGGGMLLAIWILILTHVVKKAH